MGDGSESEKRRIKRKALYTADNKRKRHHKKTSR